MLDPHMARPYPCRITHFLQNHVSSLELLHHGPGGGQQQHVHHVSCSGHLNQLPIDARDHRALRHDLSWLVLASHEGLGAGQKRP